MSVGSIHKQMNADGESETNPVSQHQIKPECGE